MRLGILGGTFNPIHLAHLRIAEEAWDRFSLDRVLFIPAATPPHKPLAGDLPFGERFAMVQLAIGDNPHFMASDLEQRRSGPSYSVDTLCQLREDFPESDLFFIIGSDSYKEICLWHRYRELFDLCSLIIIERPGSALTDLFEPLPTATAQDFTPMPDGSLLHTSRNRIHYLPGITLDISSSVIRRLAAEGYSLRYLTPEPVIHLIEKKRIYADAR